MLNRPTGLSPNKEAISLGDMVGDAFNLYNKANASEGYLDIDGTVGSSTFHRVSEYISVVGGRKYLITGGNLQGLKIGSSKKNYTVYGTWYDAGKNLIGRIMTSKGIETGANDTWYSSATNEYIAPPNASYLRVVTSRNTPLVIQGDTAYTNRLTLSAVIQSGGSVETWTDDNGEKRACCALILWYHDKYVHFYFDQEHNTAYAPYINEGKNGDSVVLSLPIDTGSSEEAVLGEYFYMTTNGLGALFSKKSIRLIDLMRTGRKFSWKLRLYGKGSVVDKENNTYFPSMRIGYGTVSDVNSVYDNSTDKNFAGYRFTVFPHLNLYDDVIDFDVDFDSNLSQNFYSGDLYDKTNENSLANYPNICDTFYNIFKNCDGRIRYWLVANGYNLEISQYRLYPVTYVNDDGNEPQKSLSFKNDFDGYGNPLSGYAVVSSDEITAVIGNGDAVDENTMSEFANETYSISTNYVDSQWGYFEIYDDPKITITSNVGETLKNGKEYDLTYSSLELNVSFSQSQGIEANYFSYRIFVYNEDTAEYECEYYSGNIYSQKIKVSYNRFLDNKKYMLSFSITDIKQRVYTRNISFNTKFQSITNDAVVNVVYYKPHNSVIIDWSELNEKLDENASDNLVGYRVYKTLGESQKLIEVANTMSDDSTILEDFIVGDNCKITYYIYPIITTTVNDIEVEAVSSPIVTQPITLDEGVDKVVGLQEIGDNVYEVLLDEVWRLWLNLDDNGYTLNNDKNFYDTFARYNQETIGNRKYITKSVSALLGHIDCSSGEEYVDTYDMLTSWNDFVSTPNMKCMIDARGLILPGSFETNPTVEYLQVRGNPATVKFNWRQKSDLDIIKIYGRLLPFNPTKGIFLQSSEKLYLTTEETDSRQQVIYGE